MVLLQAEGVFIEEECGFMLGKLEQIMTVSMNK
jgi:hypothetical protein